MLSPGGEPSCDVMCCAVCRGQINHPTKGQRLNTIGHDATGLHRDIRWEGEEISIVKGI